MSSAGGNVPHTDEDLSAAYEHQHLARPDPSLSSMSTSGGGVVGLAVSNHQAEEQDVNDIPDNDSAYGESLADEETQTLASFLTDYPYENGRRYHAYRDGSYWGPNDDRANRQQALAHHMYYLTFDGKLYHAPVQNPQQVLDIGAGIGSWAINFAELNPGAHVLGTDLSAVQPEFIPPNCSFEIDDVTLEWTYPFDHFDFIHIREMFGSIPDWQNLFQQAFWHTKPGGWIEIVEHSVEPTCDDDSIGPDHFYRHWGQTVIECGRKFGKPFSIYRHSKQLMELAGFVDVVEIKFKWPMNAWSSDTKLRELGKWNQLRLHDGVEGMMMRLLTVVMKWPYGQIQAFIKQMQTQLMDYDTHAYLEGTVVYGRKPY